jgi:hypothetical protein
MIFEQLSPDRTAISPNNDQSPLSVGQRVEIHHRPSVSGDTIVIPGAIVRLDPPYCHIDTPFQKNQRIHQKHLTTFSA